MNIFFKSLFPKRDQVPPVKTTKLTQEINKDDTKILKKHNSNYDEDFCNINDKPFTGIIPNIILVKIIQYYLNIYIKDKENFKEFYKTFIYINKSFTEKVLSNQILSNFQASSGDLSTWINGLIKCKNIFGGISTLNLSLSSNSLVRLYPKLNKIRDFICKKNFTVKFEKITNNQHKNLDVFINWLTSSTVNSIQLEFHPDTITGNDSLNDTLYANNQLDEILMKNNIPNAIANLDTLRIKISVYSKGEALIRALHHQPKLFNRLKVKSLEIIIDNRSFIMDIGFLKASFEHLVSLKLVCGSVEFKNLIEYLKLIRVLEVFKLNVTNKLNNSDLLSFVNEISQIQTLNTIGIDIPNDQPVGIGFYLNLFKQSKSLKKLYSSLRISDDYSIDKGYLNNGILEYLAISNVDSILLNNWSGDDKSLKYLSLFNQSNFVEYISHFSCVKQFALRNIQDIDPVGRLVELSTHLEYLRIQITRGIPDDFAFYIQKSKSIEALVISHSKLPKYLFKDIVQLNHPTLKVLEITNCIAILESQSMQALINNNTLVSVNVSYQTFSFPLAFEMVLQLIEKNSTLKHLDLRPLAVVGHNENYFRINQFIQALKSKESQFESLLFARQVEIVLNYFASSPIDHEKYKRPLYQVELEFLDF